MRPSPLCHLPLAVLLAACPGDGGVASDTDTTGTADATDTTSGTDTAPTGDPPPTTTGETTDTTGETTGTTGDDPTTGETTDTTGAPAIDGDARIFYTVESDTFNLARALRRVDIVDGVAMPAQTVLEAPAGETFRHVGDLSSTRRWYALNGTNTGRLWVVDTAAAAATQIVGPPDVANVGARTFSPDETLLSFTAGPMGAPSRRYVCALQPGGACEPTDTGPPAGDMGGGPGVFSPDGTRLLHGGDLDEDTGFDVLLTDLAEPGKTDVLASYPGDWVGFDFDPNRFTADGEVVHFGVDVQDNQRFEHFAVDLSVDPPGAPVPLHPPPMDEAHGYYAPDLHALLLWTRWDIDHGDLQRVELGGLVADDPVVVNTHGPHGVDPFDILWTLDSQHILWLDDHETPGTFEAYAASAAGGAPVKLSAPVTPGGGVQGLVAAPDPGAVLYVAEASGDSGFGLYWVDLAAPGEAVLLSGAGELAEVHGWSPDGARLLFTQDGADGRGLYLAFFGADGPGAVVRVDAGAPVHEGAMQFFARPVLSADGQRVFWRTEKGGGARALVTVLADERGPLGPPLELSGPDDDVVVLEALALP